MFFKEYPYKTCTKFRIGNSNNQTYYDVNDQTYYDIKW